MNRLLALVLALALALAAPMAAFAAAPGTCPSPATLLPADDAQLDTCDGLDLLKAGDFGRGRHALEMRAAKGDAFAVSGLGMMHQHGWGVPVDYDRAMGLYQSAAHDGDLLALNQIGFMLVHGLGRPADPKSAWCWFEQAAEGGLEQSANHLAELMAAGIRPAACKPSRTKTEVVKTSRAAAPATGLELWNGVREGMTPDQVAFVLTAPYRMVSSPSDHSVSDVVLAPAALFGHPAIMRVLFVDHAAKAVSLTVDPQSDDQAQNLNLARTLVSRFDVAYGASFGVLDRGGAIVGAWRRGDLSVDLNYMPLADQPPLLVVMFQRKDPADRTPPPVGPPLAPDATGT